MANRFRSLTNLIADVRNRSGLEANTFRSDTDITRYLNEGGYELAGRIAGDFPDAMYPYKTDTITTAADDPWYSVPLDCYQPYFFRWSYNGERLDIPLATSDDMDRYVTSPGWTYGSLPTHRMMGHTVDTSSPGPIYATGVKFFPTPTAAHTVTIHYMPRLIFVRLEPGEGEVGSTLYTMIGDLATAATDNMFSEWGWERYPVLSAAIMIKMDQEEDTGPLEREREQQYAIIANMVKNRTFTKANRVRDSFTDYRSDPYSGRRVYGYWY